MIKIDAKLINNMIKMLIILSIVGYCSHAIAEKGTVSPNGTIQYINIEKNKFSFGFGIDVFGKYIIMKYADVTSKQYLDVCGSSGNYYCIHLSGGWFVFSIPEDIDILGREERGSWTIGNYRFEFRKFELKLIPEARFSISVQRNGTLLSSYIVGSDGSLLVYTAYSPMTFGCKYFSKELKDEDWIKKSCEDGTYEKLYLSESFISKMDPWIPIEFRENQ